MRTEISEDRLDNDNTKYLMLTSQNINIYNSAISLTSILKNGGRQSIVISEIQK